MIFNKNSFTFLLILLFIFPFSYLFSQEIILSEIMFAPDASNSEFIEIQNISETKQIDLTRFQIKYNTASPDEIIPVGFSGILLPKQYALIFEADYNFANGLYKNIIPNDAILFVLEDNAFGSTGMSNSSDRTIYLLDSLNDTLDVYTYTANNEKGYSEERFFFNDSLWSNSIIKNGTPGKRNSITPNNIDLSIIDFYSKNKNVIIGDSIEITVIIKNLGIYTADSLILNLYKDINNDNQPQQNELIYFSKPYILNPKDSIVVYRNVLIDKEGKNSFIAKVETENDEFIDNNISSIIINGVKINEMRGDLVINEIMYAPISPEPEWVEVYNKSNKVINLKNYQLSDLKDTAIFINQDLILKPKEYFIIADDTTIIDVYPNLENYVVTGFPTLNNSDDKVILLDSLNRVIDSVYYFFDWGGGNGNSLERIDVFGSSIDETNWLESKVPTPGFINSVSQKDFNLTIDTILTNPEFPIVNDQVQLSAVVKNIGKNKIDFALELFNDIDLDSLEDNLLETSLTTFLNPGDSTKHQFNYLLELKETMKNFIVKINTSDDDTTDNSKLYQLLPAYPPGSIIVNEIMYSPANEEPEWIELYNKSEYDINLKDWSIGDILTNPVFKQITNTDFYLSSKNYLVITKSNSIFNYHKNILSDVIELKFANLNNDEDGLVLKDNRNVTIDSLRYFNEWGGTSGKSLERININFSSTNSNNWKSSSDIEESTPGRINSVTLKQFDLSVGAISVIPNNPVKGDSIKIKVKICNNGSNDAESFNAEIYYGLLFADTKLEDHANLFLPGIDSLILISEKQIEIIDTLIVSVKINYPKDEDIVNNYYQKQIIAGFNKNTALINEIMFKPSSGKPEWIEIINNTDSVINLQNWSVGDLKTKNIITQEDLTIFPDELIVISNFTSNNHFPTDIKVIQTNLPNLSNTRDAVVLYDYRNAVIDSTYYNFSSFPENISLERISLNSASADGKNWTYSLSENGSSPGRANSILLIPDYTFDEIIFNEIMFNPAETNSEFIELFNNSEREINLGGWKVEDNKGSYFMISLTPVFLKPDEYFIVAADSSIYNNYVGLLYNNLNVLNTSSLNLPNSGKHIYLKDVKENIIDSLSYSEKWHNPNIAETKNTSLELINTRINRNDSDNWSSSVSKEGATPGKINSINIESLTTTSKLNISPNPFSPDDDGFEDFTTINYNITKPVAQIRVRIFDSKGRLVRTLKNNTSSGSSGSIIFNGLNENNQALRMGIYIILFEAVGLNNTAIETIKEVVVIARKL